MNDYQFAIDMELDGVKYYTMQAEFYKYNQLQAVCLLLAEDERNHARILTEKMLARPCQLIVTNTLDKAKNIFADMGDIRIAWKETPSQFDFYKIATKKEQQSIDLYTEYLSKSENDAEKELFRYLIQQEEQHFAVLNELAEMLRHGEEWVEHAEFGIRKEY